MTRIVLDSLSHQAIRHLGAETQTYGDPRPRAGLWKDERLRGAIGSLGRAGHQLEIAAPTAATLAGAGVLLVASRSQLFPFTVAELEAITAFVAHGGSLWLMSNHRLFVAPQQQLAEALGLPLTLNDVSVSDFPTIALVVHPVTAGCAELTVRNASTISPRAGAETIATFVADPRNAFAVALEVDGARRGRVLVTADSGFIASRDDAGQKMFDAAGNARFFANAIAWLAEPQLG